MSAEQGPTPTPETEAEPIRTAADIAMERADALRNREAAVGDIVISRLVTHTEIGVNS